MPYRNPIQQRHKLQTYEIQKYAGQSAIWRQYISASSGAIAAGFGNTNYYREQWITGVFGGGGDVGGGVMSVNVEQQRAAGNIAAGQVRVSTYFKFGEQDEIVWQGVKYRVDSNSQPSLINGYWMTILSRGD